MGGGTWKNVNSDKVGILTNATDRICGEGGWIWAEKDRDLFRVGGVELEKIHI